MLAEDWLSLLLPCIAFAVNVMANFLLISVCRKFSIVKSLFLSTVAGLSAFLLVAWWGRGAWGALSAFDLTARLCAAGLTYLSASYVFFHFVHIPVASVRIRILQELADAGPLSHDEILRKYGSTEILRLRLERLTKSGQILRRGEFYVTGNRRLLYVARIFRLAKRLLNGNLT
jgi:hypothetical protein